MTRVKKIPGGHGACKKRPIQQLTVAERSRINSLMCSAGASATDALRAINKERKIVAKVDISTVYRYAKGSTPKLGAAEARGRPKSLSKGQIRRLDQARRRLIKRANNQTRVTYAAVIAEAALDNPPCQRVCEDALRAQGVGYRHPRSKIYISEKDAKQRLQVAKVWAKRPASYWVKNVHGYVDNKSFPFPLIAKQRLRFRQTLATGHLRKAEEGRGRVRQWIYQAARETLFHRHPLRDHQRCSCERQGYYVARRSRQMERRCSS